MSLLLISFVASSNNKQWYDEFLRWNVDEHQGIKSIRLPSDKIWLPDTYIYNSVNSQAGAQSTINGPYVVISNDGLVKYPVHMKLKSNCEVDIEFYPFDQQICYIK